MTNQELIDASRTTLLEIIQGKSEEWAEANESVKALKIADLRALIRDLEAEERGIVAHKIR